MVEHTAFTYYDAWSGSLSKDSDLQFYIALQSFAVEAVCILHAADIVV